MINPKILVTGATGKTGGAVVRKLLAKGVPVRAMVRTLDLRSAALRTRGAEVVVADIFDPGQLMDAMRNVQRVYYCPPYHPFVIQSASAFAAAARETGLEQIVGLSQCLAGPNHPAVMSRQLWLIDRMFAALPGIAHTIVNPGFFADSPYLEMMPFAAHLGVLPLPVAGESRNAPPSVDDIARVAFAVGAPNVTVRELTGRDAEDFETIARRHAALPESRRIGARLPSFARFIAVPILPGFNPATYDRVQEQPVPPTPHLALDDADWTASHGIEGSVVLQSPLKEAFA
jgi:uncharacterized protein YbjT (DUF2867 family)